METLKVLIYPDQRLLTPAQPVETIDDDIRLIGQRMVEALYIEEGVGLAATQVGIPLRILVTDVSEERNHPQVWINPHITAREGKVLSDEGCLSFPGIRIEIMRSEKIVVSATDLSGNPVRMEAEGLLSRCLQHEIDHLDGVVFIDHLSLLKRERIVKKFFKQLKEYN